jgi:drug/metabolite transporter (DMT)-like permease
VQAAVPLVAATLLWGSGYHATLVAGRRLPALWVACLRPALSVWILLGLGAFWGMSIPRGRAAAWAVVSGVLTTAIFFVALVEGVVRAGAADAAVLTNTAPFFVLLLASLLLGERLQPRRLAGMALGFAGVVLMVATRLGEQRGTGTVAVGTAFALAAAVASALGTVIVRRMALRDPGIDVVGLTTVQLAVGTLILLPLAFAVDGNDGSWGSGSLWAALVWLSFGSTAAASVLFFFGLRRVTAPRASAFLFLVPAVAVAIEIVLGDRPGSAALVGMALAIVGVAIVTIEGLRLRLFASPVWNRERRRYVGAADEAREHEERQHIREHQPHLRRKRPARAERKQDEGGAG